MTANKHLSRDYLRECGKAATQVGGAGMHTGRAKYQQCIWAAQKETPN